MKLFLKAFVLFFIILFVGKLQAQTQKDTMFAYLATTPVVIDGSDADACWATADWQPMSNVWIPYNQKMKDGDFSGRFKLAWDSLYLYLLVEITDDSLSDDHVNPTDNYWNDDCVEIFVDENRSKGNHERNYNAFAYHVSIAYDAIDGGTGAAINLKNNLTVVMDTIADNTYLWEFAVKMYDATFKPNSPEASRIYLNHHKLMGFSLAYCDNDETTSRENFIGSTYMAEAVANNNYITADYFGTLLLVDPNYVEPTGVSALKQNETFTIFPNPATDYLNIHTLSNNAEIHSVEIKDLSGKTLLKQIMTNESDKIFVGNLTGGMYLLQLISDDQVYSKLFVKKN